MSPHPRLTAIFNQLRGQPEPYDSVHIALGELFPLSEEQVRAEWNELANGTPLHHIPLRIRLIPAVQQCMVCFEKYHPLNQEISCPHCGSVGAKILTGEGLYLESIEAKT